jgi:hypothetical protein
LKETKLILKLIEQDKTESDAVSIANDSNIGPVQTGVLGPEVIDVVQIGTDQLHVNGLPNASCKQTRPTYVDIVLNETTSCASTLNQSEVIMVEDDICEVLGNAIPTSVNGHIITNHQAVTKSLPIKPNNGNKIKKNILIIDDSHGRDMHNILRSSLNDDNTLVSSFIKPGAGMKEVVKNVSEMTKNFTKDDVVILIGGTNDIECSIPYQQTISEALDIFIPLSKKMQLIINCIPQRFDKPEFNRDIQNANKCINNFANKTINKNSNNIRINYLQGR